MTPLFLFDTDHLTIWDQSDAKVVQRLAKEPAGAVVGFSSALLAQALSGPPPSTEKTASPRNVSGRGAGDRLG